VVNISLMWTLYSKMLNKARLAWPDQKGPSAQREKEPLAIQPEGEARPLGRKASPQTHLLPQCPSDLFQARIIRVLGFRKIRSKYYLRMKSPVPVEKIGDYGVRFLCQKNACLPWIGVLCS